VGRPTASLEYVDSDGAPLDVRAAIWGTAACCGALSGYLLVSCLAGSTSGRGFGFGVRAGAGVVLGAAALSRVWALVYGRVHLAEDRGFWLTHAANGRRRALIGAVSVLVVAVPLLVVVLRSGSTLAAGVLVGPLFGALFVLAALGDRAQAATHPRRYRSRR
jgi:hypothetical protein